MKISPVGAELFHAYGRAGGRTDMTKLVVAFRNFANAPKKGMCVWVSVAIVLEPTRPNVNLYAHFLSFFLTTFTYFKLLEPFTGCYILCSVSSWLAPLGVKSNSNFTCAYRHKQLY